MKCMDCSEYGGNRFLKGTFRNPFSTCGSKLIGDEFFFHLQLLSLMLLEIRFFGSPIIITGDVV